MAKRASPLKSRQLAAQAQRAERASAGPGGSGRALRFHAVNRAPEEGQVNPAACHVRVVANHVPRKARQNPRDILQALISALCAEHPNMNARNELIVEQTAHAQK